MQKKKNLKSNMEVGTLKNHNNKLKTEREKTTNKDKRKKTNKSLKKITSSKNVVDSPQEKLQTSTCKMRKWRSKVIHPILEHGL
jgi:FtsZ-binding cell division protein ZapB